MVFQKEVPLSIESIPIFNVIKYFIATVIFGTVLDTAASRLDSTFARRELSSQGWTGFPNRFLPRINRPGLQLKLSVRTGFALLSLCIALVSDVFDELSYDAKQVPIERFTTEKTFEIIKNGSVPNHGFFSVVIDRTFEGAGDCLGKVRGKYYADRSVNLVCKDTDEADALRCRDVDVNANQTGLRQLFHVTCGSELDNKSRVYPLAFVRNTTRVDKWLASAGAKLAKNVSLPFDIKRTGPTEFQFVEMIAQLRTYDKRRTTYGTFTLTAVFPQASCFCAAAITPRGDSLPQYLLCWKDKKEIIHLRVLYNDKAAKRALKDFITLGMVQLNGTLTGGETLVRGITDIASFQTWCVIYVGYNGPIFESPLNTILAARLAVLSMRYTSEFAGKEVTVERDIRPVIRMVYFLPSFLIVISGACAALFLKCTNRTTSLTNAEGLAAHLSRVRSREAFGEAKSSRNVYAILEKCESLDHSFYHVTVGQDIYDAQAVTDGEPIHGLSGCLRTKKFKDRIATRRVDT